MTNSSDKSANQKIVIQDATGVPSEINFKDDFISLLSELKSLLKKSNAKEFQIADKIYNIENINEANFGLLTGKTSFNETLTKRLVEALKPHNRAAERIAKKIDEIESSGTGRVQDFLKKIFVGVIGVQLRKLFAIGKKESTELNQRNYIEKCIYITKRSFDLINFTLLSELWEVMRDQNVSINDDQKEILGDRFDSEFEHSITEQFEVLKTLYDIFTFNKLTFPIPELAGDEQNQTQFASEVKYGSALQTVCKRIQILADKGKTTYDMLDCYEAETQLAALLGHFYFLIHYNMVSIKRIDYRQIRNIEPFYLHNYASLGSEKNISKINCSPETVHTHAVLLYRGDNYTESINLFPFVIDYNALSLEEGTLTYFFNAKEIEGDGLSYICLEKEETKEIKNSGIGLKNKNLNELLVDKSARVSFNLDCVADQFQSARDCILGLETKPSTNNSD